jgi:hypothetical protein
MCVSQNYQCSADFVDAFLAGWLDIISVVVGGAEEINGIQFKSCYRSRTLQSKLIPSNNLSENMSLRVLFYV